MLLLLPFGFQQPIEGFEEEVPAKGVGVDGAEGGLEINCSTYSQAGLVLIALLPQDIGRLLQTPLPQEPLLLGEDPCKGLPVGGN